MLCSTTVCTNLTDSSTGMSIDWHVHCVGGTLRPWKLHGTTRLKRRLLPRQQMQPRRRQQQMLLRLRTAAHSSRLLQVLPQVLPQVLAAAPMASPQLQAQVRQLTRALQTRQLRPTLEHQRQPEPRLGLEPQRRRRIQGKQRRRERQGQRRRERQGQGLLRQASRIHRTSSPPGQGAVGVVT
jgi:hypothetical protein